MLALKVLYRGARLGRAGRAGRAGRRAARRGARGSRAAAAHPMQLAETQHFAAVQPQDLLGPLEKVPRKPLGQMRLRDGSPFTAFAAAPARRFCLHELRELCHERVHLHRHDRLGFAKTL